MEEKTKVMGEKSWVKLKIKLSTANAENCRPIRADTIKNDENLLPSCFGSFWNCVLTKSFIKDISDEWGLFYCENIARWLRGWRTGLNVGLQSISEAVSRPFVNRTRSALPLNKQQHCLVAKSASSETLALKRKAFHSKCRSGWELQTAKTWIAARV